MIYFVRHAESVIPGPGTEDEYTRPLTLHGMQQAQDLVPGILALNPVALYSSPYLRAIQTLEPTSERLGLPITALEDFREHMMCTRPIDNWREVLRASWDDLDWIYQDGDSMRSTLSRGMAVVQSLLQRHVDEPIVLAGHGTIISLILHHFDSSIGFDFHLSLPSPAIVSLEAFVPDQD